MTQPPSSPQIPKAAVRGAASGVFFMAFFGTLWAGIGIGGLEGRGNLWLGVLAILIGLGLLAGGIYLMAASRQVPDREREDDKRRGKRIGIWFGIIFAMEGLAIAAASIICSAAGRFELFFPVMAIIVGAHFFPLAPLFRFNMHYVTGGLICLLAIVTLFVVPEKAMLGGDEVVVWWIVVGFGSAVILWITGLLLWLYARNLLDKALQAR